MRQPLGQHFLHDMGVVESILAAGEISPTDHALEIGPGEAALTERLAARVAALTAVELDRRLAQNLQHRYVARSAIRIVHEDFLKSDLDSLFPETLRPVKLFGNLPYSITAPIFEKILAWPGWSTGVFLVQWEVAERMMSDPGSKTFGILSLAVQLFAEVELVRKVKPGAFRPPPRVMSAVIRLKRFAAPRLDAAGQQNYFDLVHAAFAHRRKTILNSVAMATACDKDLLAKWMRAQDIDPERRAETFGVETFAKLAGPWAIFHRSVGPAAVQLE